MSLSIAIVLRIDCSLSIAKTYSILRHCLSIGGSPLYTARRGLWVYVHPISLISDYSIFDLKAGAGERV